MRSYVIRTLIQMVQDKELVLPALQRPFVWAQDRILRLMDSLLRRFPLGTILVWSTKEAQRFRTFREHASSDEQPVFTFEHATVGGRKLDVHDGQQRLTTLLVALKGTLDDKRLYLNALSGNAEGKDPGEMYYEFQFMTSVEADEANRHPATPEIPRKYFVPFEDFTKIEPVDAPMKAAKLAKERGFDEEDQQRLSMTYTLASGCLVSDRALQVHVIDEHGETQTPLEEILEVFVRVNSGGLVLNKSDLLMSLLDLSWEEVQPELMRISRDVSANSPLKIDRDMILKSALLYIDEDARFHKLVQDRNSVKRIAPKLAGAMGPIQRGWKLLTVILVDDCKIRSSRFFRQASNALLPFAVYLAHNPNCDRTQRHRIVTGIYMTLMSGVFGSAEARAGSFARKCARSGEFPLQKLGKLVADIRWVKNLDDLLSLDLDLTLNITHGGITLDGNPDELERDHIFPRALLQKLGVADSQINHYANFHFLRQKDNRNKTDKPPSEWFKEPGQATAYTDREMDERLLSSYIIQPGAFSQLVAVRGQRIPDKALGMFHLNDSEFEALLH